MNLTPLLQEYFKVTVKKNYIIDASLGTFALTYENDSYYVDGRVLTQDEIKPVEALLKQIVSLADMVLPDLSYQVISIHIQRGARLGESKIKMNDGLQLYTQTRCEFIYDPQRQLFENIWEKESRELKDELEDTELKKPHIFIKVDEKKEVLLADVIKDIFKSDVAEYLLQRHYWLDPEEV